MFENVLVTFLKLLLNYFKNKIFKLKNMYISFDIFWIPKYKYYTVKSN